jgi:splicing factor 3B subunit 3
VTEDGIVQSVCEQPVFGTIKDLRVLPWNESRRSPLPQVVFAILYT